MKLRTLRRKLQKKAKRGKYRCCSFCGGFAVSRIECFTKNAQAVAERANSLWLITKRCGDCKKVEFKYL